MLLFFLACVTQESEYAICEDICNELYQTCQFEAYPSWDSCLEGCAYNGEEGANLEEQYTCFTEAECDTFTIIECENKYGESSDETE